MALADSCWGGCCRDAGARAIGYEGMRLDTVASAMQDAIARYRKLGFVEIAPYSSIPVGSALWMELAL